MFESLKWFLQHEDIIETQIDSLILSKCKILQDFGPFKAGDEIDNLTFDFLEGTCTEYNNAGEVVNQCKIAVVCFDYNAVQLLADAMWEGIDEDIEREAEEEFDAEDLKIHDEILAEAAANELIEPEQTDPTRVICPHCHVQFILCSNIEEFNCPGCKTELLLCNYCGEFNHNSVICPARNTPISGPCTYCGSADHWRPDCPQIPIDIASGAIQQRPIAEVEQAENSTGKKFFENIQPVVKSQQIAGSVLGYTEIPAPQNIDINSTAGIDMSDSIANHAPFLCPKCHATMALDDGNLVCLNCNHAINR